MINKEMQGRLGNQMFQYATMYAFQKDNHLEENYNLSFTKVMKTQKNFYDTPNTLKDYQIDNINVVDHININLLQKLLVFIVRSIEFMMRKIIHDVSSYEYHVNCFEKSIQPLLNMCSVYFMTFGYCQLKKGLFKNSVFYGNFESPKYFDKYQDDLRKLFTPREELHDCNKALYKKILSTNSVCITIRRGDFLSAKNKNKFYSCDEKYFYDAISIMSKKLKNPQFFVFSDDIIWCKNNMKFPSGTLFESGNDPVYEKLRLMCSCKHFIISNSTFSWWCQFLSCNKKKIVIAPKYWRNYGYYQDIYEDNWLLIDNSRKDHYAKEE